MKLRTQLYVSYALVTLTTMGVIATEIGSRHAQRKQVEIRTFVNLYLKDVFELNLLTHELNLFHDIDRPLEQMKLKLKILTDRFRELSAGKIFSANEIGEIKNTLEAIHSLLGYIQPNREIKESSEKTLKQELNDRLGIQLLQRSQTLYGRFYITRQRLVEREAKAEFSRSAFRAGALLILCLVYLINVFLFQRRITRSLFEVESGAIEVTKGNIDFLFPIKTSGSARSRDEIDAVKSAFNIMLISLNKSLAEVKKINQDMEKIVEKRTQEIVTLNQDLAHRNAALLETNTELDSFSYSISHDLKAPLRGIANLSNWIVQDYGDKLDEKGKGFLATLTNRVSYMQALIDGILEHARIGRQRGKTVQIDLKDLIGRVVALLQPPAGIHIEVPDDLPKVRAEQTRIHQLFQNLLDNAIKFMDKPKGTIQVGYEDAGDMWRFSVSDNGPGIEQKYFERIFQLFQTLDSYDKAGSTGVGLALVKKIVDLYGGSIHVQSEVGKGSTFFFTLPKG
jgi:signal transduction histidine kinase